jgi:hypothetical protein
MPKISITLNATMIANTTNRASPRKSKVILLGENMAEVAKYDMTNRLMYTPRESCPKADIATTLANIRKDRDKR